MQRHPSLPSFGWAGSVIAVLLCQLRVLAGNKSSAFLAELVNPLLPELCHAWHPAWGSHSKLGTSAVSHCTESWNKSSGTVHKLSVGNICVKLVFLIFPQKSYYPQVGVVSLICFLMIICMTTSCAARDKHGVKSFKINIVISHTREKCHMTGKTLKVPRYLNFPGQCLTLEYFFFFL